MRRRKSGLARQLMGHAGGELGPKPDDLNSLIRANVEGRRRAPTPIRDVCAHTITSNQKRKENLS